MERVDGDNEGTGILGRHCENACSYLGIWKKAIPGTGH